MGRSFIKIALTVFVLFLFVIYLANNGDSLQALTEVQFGVIVLLIIIKFLLLTVRSLVYGVMLKPFEVDLKLQEGVFAAYATTFGNYFLPMQSGAVLRAAFFKRRFGFPYNRFVVLLSGMLVMSFLLNSLLALASLVYINLTLGQYSYVLYVFFLAVFISTLVIVLLDIPRINFKFGIKILRVFMDYINDTITGWNQLKKYRSVLVKVVGILIFDFFLSAVQYYIQLNSIGAEVNIASIMLYTSLASISIIINITPGSLGVREAILILSTVVLGLSGDQVILASVIDRGATFIMLVMTHIFFSTFKSNLVAETFVGRNPTG